MRRMLPLAIVIALGCASSDRRFVDVGGNRGVPESSITRRAKEKGITFDEARREIDAESNAPPTK
jgi:hypothetical protein